MTTVHNYDDHRSLTVTRVGFRFYTWHFRTSTEDHFGITTSKAHAMRSVARLIAGDL
jgi:hypothetical protein